MRWFLFVCKVMLFSVDYCLCYRLCSQATSTWGTHCCGKKNKQIPNCHLSMSYQRIRSRRDWKWFTSLHYADPEFSEVITLCLLYWETHLVKKKKKGSKFTIRGAARINYGINTLSYCGNTSKSDWGPEACKQIDYSKQRVIWLQVFMLWTGTLCLMRKENECLLGHQFS